MSELMTIQTFSKRTGISKSALRYYESENSPITEIHTGYTQLMNYAMEHEFIPAGPIIEWYRGKHFEDLDLLMPVARISKMEGRS
jgi:hypothetical protein